MKYTRCEMKNLLNCEHRTKTCIFTQNSGSIMLSETIPISIVSLLTFIPIDVSILSVILLAIALFIILRNYVSLKIMSLTLKRDLR